MNLSLPPAPPQSAEYGPPPGYRAPPVHDTSTTLVDGARSESAP